MLSSQIATAKLALKVRRYRSDALNNAAAKVEQLADSSAVHELRQRMAEVYRQEPTSA